MNIPYLVYSIASMIIRVAEFLMLVRAVFSWIPVPPSLSGIYRAVYSLTEPIIAPFRRLLTRFDFVRRCPIDLSFLAAVLVLEFLMWLFRVVCLAWMF